MAQISAKGPASPPKPPPVPGPTGAPTRSGPAARPNTKATLIGVTAPAAVAKVAAPLAPKAPLAIKSPKSSSPDTPVVPTSPRNPDPSPAPAAAESPSPPSDAGARITPVAALVHAAETPKRLPTAADWTPNPAPVEEARPPRATFASAPEPREDAAAAARAAIAEALMPHHLAMRELVRRIDELEKRVMQTTATASAAVSVNPSAGHEAYRPAVRSSAALEMASLVGSAPAAARIDLPAVEVEMDGLLDGSRRRRRLAVTFAVFLLVVFGGLFAALANSYSPSP